jgi:riboflavin kinase/FMN adenylyltransferase
MEIVRSLAELDVFAGRSVVTVGNFDGVHRGHRMVIAHVRERAREMHARAIAVTFDPHPAHVLLTSARLPLITPTEEKLELLAETGLDCVVVLPFDGELRRWTAREFAERVLGNALSAVEVHEGETFRFGHNAAAGIDSLRALGRECAFAVRTYEPLRLRGGPVSSSRIRALVRCGMLAEARALLGRSFSIRSTPAPGRGYGTRYAVPTINLADYRDLVPADGVYVSTLRLGEGAAARVFRGVTNVGNRPTFGVDSFAIETHLFGFEPMALDESTPLELTFLWRLRAERKFESAEALREQIGRDVARAQRYFALCEAMGREG